MNLSAEQVAAAEAAGCSFVPVSADSLHRYAMQRKLFRVQGREMLATRGGGLYETASTLAPLIDEGRARLAVMAPPVLEPAEAVVVDAPVAPEPVAPEAVAPEPATAEPMLPEPPAGMPEAPAPRRKPRLPRAAAPVPAEADAAPGTSAPLPVAQRERGRRQGEAPRWATAGAERRGRSEAHWSRKGR